MPVYVIAFESTHAAMAAEASFGSVPHAMIPTPRQITASCGMALRFEAEDDAAARGLFARQDGGARKTVPRGVGPKRQIEGCDVRRIAPVTTFVKTASQCLDASNHNP